MIGFQSFLRSSRESKNLQQQTVADATNLSIKTIQMIEKADNNSLLQNSNTLLKNQVRRYCEYLEIHEKKIISILNNVDILYYKKSRYGKLRLFDYINRLAIATTAVVVIILITKHAKENIYQIPEAASSPVIYTPINYEPNKSDQDRKNIEFSDNEL